MRAALHAWAREALEVLAERSQLLEVGAGLGYWAALLRQRGVVIQALDSHPTSGRGGPANQYHGRIPAYTQVNWHLVS